MPSISLNPYSELKTALWKIAFFLFALFTLRHQAPLLSSLYDPGVYVVVHTILESFSIAASFFIYFQSVLLFRHFLSRNLLLIGYTFFVVAALDLMHTLSYNEMPYLFFSSSIQKATYFWILTRLSEAVMLLLITCLPETMVAPKTKRLLMAGFLVYLVSAVFVVLRFEQHLPPLVMEGAGTTALKNAVEYFICSLYAVNILLLIRKHRKTGETECIYLMLASVLIVISELLFTSYKTVSDADNLLGHLYNMVGCYYLLTGFSSIRIHKVYAQVKRAQKELRHVVHEQQGIIFEFVKIRGGFVHTLCDGSLLAHIGYTPKQIVGRSPQELMAPEKAQYVEAYYDRAWQGMDQLFELELSTSITAFVTLKPVIEGGRVVEVIGSCINITHLKSLQQKLNDNERKMEKLNAVGQLAASISHEVRNPLTVTRGFLQLLIKSGITEKQKDYAVMALAELDRAEGIITDYLTFAKPDIERFDILQVDKELGHVISFITPFASMHLVDIQYACIGSPRIYGDSSKFRQCILNLMKNGIEAMPNGGVMDLEVSSDSHRVSVSITDNGLGMEQEQLDRLGTPYYSTKEKGTGLGLMVVYSLVKAMNGSIEVASTKGLGTRFRLEFPRQDTL